uniref:Vesicle-associated membrane protein-associated protein A n=1 Tax=Hucho hucho TaxID=62062 RepID=A0A4W5QMI4_9TELE
MTELQRARDIALAVTKRLLQAFKCICEYTSLHIEEQFFPSCFESTICPENSNIDDKICPRRTATPPSCSSPFTEVVTTNLKLKNPSDRKVCFKVKTTAPRRYCVRPNSGMIESGATVTVSVMLQPFEYDPNEKSKHKFMVQTIFAPSTATDMDAVWKDAKPDDLMDSKLKCVFELPSENDKMNDVDATKTGPVLNSKADGTSAPRPSSASMDDSEIKKLMAECKRLQYDVGKLSDENRQLKDEGLRMRKSHRSDDMVTGSGAMMSKQHSSSSLPSLMVVIAAIFIGFFLGKFVL